MKGPTTMVKQVTGGEAAIAALEAAGVDVVFGIPGVHTLALYDALHGRSIRHVLARHEQGAGFMADGYARATGKPGVALIITGPGITNVSTPVGEAYADSSPIVIISSQVDREWAGGMRGNLHDIRDQSGLMSVLTKRSTPVSRHSDIASTVYGAVGESVSGRPRPVHIEIPLDILAEKGGVEQPESTSSYRPSPARAEVERAVGLLTAAAKPMIYTGGGAQHASQSITELAETLGAPVISSIMGKGVVSEDHPYGLGHAWDPWGSENPIDELIRACDVMIVFGSKLGAQETNFWKMPAPATVIRVDIDPAELTLNYGEPTLGIAADCQATADAILEVMRQRGARPSPRTPVEEVDSYRDRIGAKNVDDTYYPYIRELRGAIPREGIIVQDMTMMSYRMNDAYPAYAPRTYLFPSNYGTLGFSLPAAIGARIGKPDTPVVAVVGDGGFQFTMQEVATAAQFKVTLPIVIFNDASYTAVEQAMKHGFDGRIMATDLVNPDFVKLADAYGIPGTRAESPEALADAVRAALDGVGPTIIDVPIPRM
ncbi:MAG TPA: thiamine pyrophosphate-dependent enzyme [Thermomicrobiales bacterium]|nr:thiamine pyrophosphate-dependent enzyme [Thermomicrobiales bacterium]